MERTTELALLDELLALRDQGSAYLVDDVQHSPVDRYTDPLRHQHELHAAFRPKPQLAALSSELPEPGSFVRRTLTGVPLIVLRDQAGVVRAYHNVCRHRGATLVDEDAGCRKHLQCPYHAWTWSLEGRLLGVPHRRQGFGDLDDEAYALSAVPVAERHGIVWVKLEGGSIEEALDELLTPLAPDLERLGLDGLVPFAAAERDWACNWKLLAEGGLESYHFRVLHADSIASFFQDNLSTYQRFGLHFRSILPRRSLDDLPSRPRDEWRLRDHCNTLYTVFPNVALLVQSDHVVLFVFEPVACDRSRVRMATLRPRLDRPLTDEESTYWERNHAVTRKALYEDFRIAERIQEGFATGANAQLTFGRFEGALHAFHQTLDHVIGG